MLKVQAVSRSAPYSSQALKEKIMAQYVKLTNALSPSDKQVWDMMAADLSCEHARDIGHDVQHAVDAINFFHIFFISRVQASFAPNVFALFFEVKACNDCGMVFCFFHASAGQRSLAACTRGADAEENAIGDARSFKHKFKA